MSARNVYAACDNEKYAIELCYIDRRGKWWLLEKWTDTPESHGGSQLVAIPGSGSFMTLPGNSILRVDVLFPILHGKNGEDGTVQGLATLLHVPIVGCDTTASALTMDKVLTKQVLEANAIDTAPYVVYRKGNVMPIYDHVVQTLGETLFIKPSRSGSSMGVSKVHDEAEFLPAIQSALKHDDRVLIERAITGRELETAVLGIPPNHKVSGVGEIIPGAEFYDYDDKYSADSMSKVIINAEISHETREAIRATSQKAFEVLGCSGLARIDYLLEGERFYVIEVNTLPGFTNISMYPKLWRETGLHYSDLINTLIEAAA
jgi:D-alanine-D-alanine ligase